MHRLAADVFLVLPVKAQNICLCSDGPPLKSSFCINSNTCDSVAAICSHLVWFAYLVYACHSTRGSPVLYWASQLIDAERRSLFFFVTAQQRTETQGKICWPDAPPAGCAGGFVRLLSLEKGGGGGVSLEGWGVCVGWGPLGG